MTDCTMGHKKQTLPNGTTAEIVICMKLTDYNKNDQKAVFNFFDEYSNSFFTVKIPGIAGGFSMDANEIIEQEAHTFENEYIEHQPFCGGACPRLNGSISKTISGR